MIKYLFFSFSLVSSAFAYVPTVESLFRHGSNPEVTANGISVTFSVKRIQAGPKETVSAESQLLVETKDNDYYKLFFSKLNNDVMKVAQTRYANNSFSESSLQEKIYFSNFTHHTFKNNPEEAEKGIFLGILKSMVFNDGTFLINYLKTLGVPVKANAEIINREKIDYLASYKRYLISIGKNRSAKKTEINPLRPEDASAREKAERVMTDPMYVDLRQVSLSRQDGQMAWLASAGAFESVVSYKERDIQRVKYKSALGDFEIVCKDYWLANGTHSLPRYILVKDFKGENFQIEITNLRHYLEKEEDIVKRLKKWDELLRGKESLEPKPPFLL